MNKAQKPACKWYCDRHDGDRAIWKTECGREFDRLEAGEQPRKDLAMEYCPFCAGVIVDMTQDC